jgi:hypothetical protein
VCDGPTWGCNEVTALPNTASRLFNGRRKEVTKMKVLKTAMLTIIAVGLAASFTFAAGDVAKGKVLFNDAKLAGGTAGMSCNSCHPGGKGLEKAVDKKDIEKTINLCIEQALKGKTIDPKSAEMTDIVAYIMSLKETE